MLRRFPEIMVILALSGHAGAGSAESAGPRPLNSALIAFGAQNWPRALDLARRDGPGAVAILEAQRLENGLGTPEEFDRFARAYPLWPGLDRMRAGLEPQINGLSAAEILSFYDETPPQTGDGVLAYAGALEGADRAAEAREHVIAAWKTMDLSSSEHDAFIARYEALLRPHHAVRLDMTLWRDLKDTALMLPLVDAGTRQVAEVRQALNRGTGEAMALADAVPGARAGDAGLALARFNALMRAERSEDAIALLLRQSEREDGLGQDGNGQNGLGQPEKWASWRRYLARAQMRDGNGALAYRIAASHHLSEGSNFADLEWLSGYIALRYLDNPSLALSHFQTLQDGVNSPISLGRAHYWVGRAFEAAGETEAAQDAYALGAGYQTSFYGLLAAEKAGVPFAYTGTPVAAQGDSALAEMVQYQAAIVARAAGIERLSERLLGALADGLSAPEVAQLLRLTAGLDDPHLELSLAKRAAQRGLVIPEAYYPLHPMRALDLPVVPELALSIARRESEFDPQAASSAGALGLMQILPGTARDVAGSLGLSYDKSRLTHDWVYNARLGSGYLAGLWDRFDGNIVLISAGYNAGPGRPLQWMEARGDPRGKSAEEIVDWIEHIPFRETRNYVMRVAESLPVYRARLGHPALPVPFSQELSGASPTLSAPLSQ